MKTVTQTALLFIALSFIACEPPIGITTIDDYQDDRLINEEEAINIAENFFSDNTDNISGKQSGKSSKIKIQGVKGSHGKNAIYIANNEEGGWQIIAGTKLKNPTLAYGFNGEFQYDTLQMNSGLKMWLSNTVTNMVLAYNNPDSYVEGIEKLNESNIAGREPIGDGCEDIHLSVAPLVVDANGNEALFSQGFPENYFYPSCSGGVNAPSGCVPIAIAQIMWYYQSPSTFNWNNIPRNPAAGNSTQEIAAGTLVKAIHDALEPYIWVSCNLGTGALTDTFNNLDRAMGNFGYDTYKFSSSTTLRNELTAGRPVIAVGGNAIEQNRHAWVIDGYNYSSYCESGTSYLFLHCNWGWGDEQANDFFGINGFTPAGQNFNANIKYHKVIMR